MKKRGARLWIGTSLMMALALVASACRQQQPPPPAMEPPQGETSSPAPAQMPPIALTQHCTNEEAGYTVAYPAGWEVNRGDVVSPCSLFDPEPIALPEASEIPHDIAVQIGVEPVPFATLAGDIMGRRTISREETTVAGRRAVRIEGESTGEGLLDRGVRSYEYVIDLGDETLVAAAYDLGSPSFAEKRRVLDSMAEALQVGPHRIADP